MIKKILIAVWVICLIIQQVRGRLSNAPYVRNLKDEEVLIYIGDLTYSENTILENYDTKKRIR